MIQESESSHPFPCTFYKFLQEKNSIVMKNDLNSYLLVNSYQYLNPYMFWKIIKCINKYKSKSPCPHYFVNKTIILLSFQVRRNRFLCKRASWRRAWFVDCFRTMAATVIKSDSISFFCAILRYSNKWSKIVCVPFGWAMCVISLIG